MARRLPEPALVKRSPAVMGFGVAAFALVLRIPTLAEPRWYSDESVFTTVAWAMTQGVKLYSGVYDLQPPAIYWLYWLLLNLGGEEHHVVIQLAISVFVIATALLTFEIARRFVALWPATLAGLLIGFFWALPTLDGDLLNVELAALPFFLASLLMAFSPRLILVFASGVLLGVALAFRPSFAIDGLALLVPLLHRSRGEFRILLAAAGVAAVLALVVLGLWLEGSWAPYVNVVMPSDRRYFLSKNGSTILPILVRTVLLAVAGLYFFLRARSIFGRLLAVWLPASLAASSLTPVDYTHFAHEAAPPLAIGIAMIASRYQQRWRAAALAALALVLSAELLLILPQQQTAFMRGEPPPRPLQHNFGYEVLPAYYANWFLFAAGLKKQSDYEAWFPQVTALKEQSAVLKANGVHRGETLQVVGGQGWLYFDNRLLPATPYLDPWVGDWLVPAAGPQIRTNLSQGCADVVIAVDWRRLAQLQDDINRGGYVPLEGAPWATYRAQNPGQSCS